MFLTFTLEPVPPSPIFRHQTFFQPFLAFSEFLEISSFRGSQAAFGRRFCRILLLLLLLSLILVIPGQPSDRRLPRPRRRRAVEIVPPTLVSGLQVVEIRPVGVGRV